MASSRLRSSRSSPSVLCGFRRSQLGRRRPPASRRALSQHRRRQRRLARLGRRVLRRRALAALAVQHRGGALVRLRDSCRSSPRRPSAERSDRSAYGELISSAGARGARRHALDRARLLRCRCSSSGARAPRRADRRRWSRPRSTRSRSPRSSTPTSSRPTPGSLLQARRRSTAGAERCGPRVEDAASQRLAPVFVSSASVSGSRPRLQVSGGLIAIPVLAGAARVDGR